MRFFRNKQKLTGKISILIPTMFDSRYIIELCLKSIIKNTTYPDYQIIVCDCSLNQETREYLSSLQEKDQIKLIKATDIERPKDDLVKTVDSDYYVIMHDDIKIINKGWLTRRLELLNMNPNNAIVGSIVKNNFSKNGKSNRFFPLGLLVRTDVSRELNLEWGKQAGFDTGALAYRKFISQDKYKYVPYKVSKDIYHFSEMSWTKRKEVQHEECPGLDEKLRKREDKIEQIKEILKKEAY